MKPSVFISLLLTLYIICAVAVYVFAPGTDFGFILRNVFYLGAPFIAIIAGVYAVSSYGVPNSHALSLAFIVAGLSFWFIGEVLFFSFSLRGIDPFPSIADFFYVLGYFPLAIGFIREAHSSSRAIRKRDLVFFVSLLVVLTAITLYTSIFKVYDPEVSIAANSILIGYGVADLVLLAAMLPTLIFVSKHTGGSISYPWRLLLIAIVFILAADLLYSMFSMQYDARQTDVLQIDIIWIIGYLSFAAAFISMGNLLRGFASQAQKTLPRGRKAA